MPYGTPYSTSPPIPPGTPSFGESHSAELSCIPLNQKIHSSQLVANEFAIPLHNQTAFVGAKLIITSQIPPLPQPVDVSTPPDLLTQHITIEEITVIDTENYRVAWVLLSPDWILNTIRWSAVSTVVDNDGVEKSYYESRETFNGPLASVVQDLLGNDIAESFQAQADALKVWMEA